MRFRPTEQFARDYERLPERLQQMLPFDKQEQDSHLVPDEYPA
jgi:hypothetical protein